MPTYNDLRPDDDFKKKDYELVFPQMTKPEKKRTIQNLLALRKGLDERVAVKKADHNLIVASWNIKEFGHTTQRLSEAYFYIAEIINRFDLVIVQEVKSTLKDLQIIMQLLGPDWSYVINDITEGDAGNSERSAYLLNKKRVEFAGLAGEIVLWEELTAGSSIKQLKRTPFMTGFRAGWKTFAIINLHLHPGEADDDFPMRREEVRLLLLAIKEKVTKGRLWNENLILAGDFNLYRGAGANKPKDEPTILLFGDHGFREIDSLVGVDTNASQTEAYDRMFLTHNEYFTLGKNEQGTAVAGVFDCFEHVFKIGQESSYTAVMQEQYTGSKDMTDPANLSSYYKHPWRKNQMSDHFPVWFELIIDSSDEFLEEKLASY
jgi:endonuclease/exonuclease/phosphatase family metal-dependent hydrolase